MSGWCVCACNAKGRVQFWKVSRRIQTWDATRRRNSELLKLGIPNSQKLQNSNWRICGLVHITWGSKPSWLLAFPSGLKPSLTAGSYWSLSTVCTRGLQQMKDRLFSYRWPVAIFSIYPFYLCLFCYCFSGEHQPAEYPGSEGEGAVGQPRNDPQTLLEGKIEGTSPTSPLK